MRATLLALGLLLAFSAALVPDAPWTAAGEAQACIPHVNGCSGCLTGIQWGPHDGPRRCL